MSILKNGLKVISLLHQNGFEAFYVGGAIRDSILGRPSNNLDIATDALPDEIERILSSRGIKTKGIGKKFGTVLAVLDKIPVEITTYRQEGFHSDKRHPDQVRFITDYREDAKRRDFTANALYLDPQTGQIYDPTGGKNDINAKLLRFVGDPKKRIDEDALRMLRGVRLATQLGFKLEKNSFAAIKTRAKYIQRISGERIKAELDKILLSEYRVRGMELLDGIGLLKFIIPEMEPLKKFSHQSKLYHLEGNMFRHTMLALGACQKADLDLLYALLFHDIGKPLVAEKVYKNGEWVISTKGHGDTSAETFLKFAKKLSFTRQQTKNIEWLIRKHMTQTAFAEMAEAKQLALAVNPVFPLLVEHWHCDESACLRAVENDGHSRKYAKSKSQAKRIMRLLESSKERFKWLADGNLIMKHAKLKPGRELGRKIADVKKEIVFQRIKTESDLKKYLKNT